MNLSFFLQQHPKINYLQRCIRRFNDRNFLQEVLEIGKNPLRIHILEKGNENPGKLIYICQTLGCDGFFAELRFILHELFFAEHFGFIPIVKMSPNSCYAEKEPINGTINPFEYYFMPVSDISLESAEKSYSVIEHNFYQREYIKNIYSFKSGYLPPESYMAEMARLVQKYLKFNENTSTFLDVMIKELLQHKRTLGIHVRGADFKRHYINHPNIVTIDEYLNAANKMFHDNNYEKIFLATDDLEALRRFKEVFAKKLVFYEDVIRTDSDETVMRSESPREMHHFLLGREVIRDMVTLSRCDGIVAGLSNVSIFARIMKLSTESDFSNMNYINKGIKT